LGIAELIEYLKPQRAIWFGRRAVKPVGQGGVPEPSCRAETELIYRHPPGPARATGQIARQQKRPAPGGRKCKDHQPSRSVIFAAAFCWRARPRLLRSDRERSPQRLRARSRAQCLGAAPLPMLDQIAEQLTGPADAAFEKREAQLREAPGDAAEENRLGGRVTGGGEPSPSVGWRRGLFLLLR